MPGAGLKDRIGAVVLRWGSRREVDLSKVRFLPSRITMPLRRDGLDPLPALRRLADETPVSRLKIPFGPTAWLVTSHEVARTVLADKDTYSTDVSHLLGEDAKRDQGGLGFTDPPDHTRLRKFLTPEFTMRRLSRLGPRIDQIVSDRLDAMVEAGPTVDLVQEFAIPIPFEVICELIGLDDIQRKRLEGLGQARFDISAGGTGAFGAVSQSREVLADAVAQQRLDPGEGLLGQIIREHGDAISDHDLTGLLDGLFTGGFETTASMIALGTVLLLREDLLASVAGADDDAVHRTVEEMLRYLTVVQVAFPRFARVDHDLHGTAVSKGDVVMCSLLATDRDRELVDGDPDVFDPTRPPSQHDAFGYGFHRCVGAELARMELRAAFPALARRFPGLRLAVDAKDVEYRKLSLVFGVESLPVRLR
ncbi:cytochrome P450 [Solicola sp. PLA-1-18]|uniref:cytochrome P450 n=1 Tax=Solicola sp. PLA-1-18 TaxID=3380532 RepID=UPI003B7ECAAE